MKRFAQGLTLVAVALCTGPVDGAEVVINVAFGNRTTYSMSGISSDDPVQAGEPGTGTAAPLEYAGATWNEGVASGSDLLDSDGNVTAVGFSATQFKDSPGDWGGPGILQFLGAGLHADSGYGGPPWQPDPGTVPTITISGLDDGKTYDLVVVMRDGRDGCINQYNVGGLVDWTDPNQPVFDGGTTLVASNPTAQGATWVEGENYVKFAGLTPVDGAIVVGVITVSGRNTMNGFQLLTLEESTQAPLPPTDLVATGGDKAVSLAWSAPAPGPEPPPTQYLVFRGTVKIDDVTAPTTSYVDDDPSLAPGTQYCYTVKSRAGDRTSGPSNEACGTPTEGAPVFHRGDANADGAINITDGIFVLNFLFLGGPMPACAEAANPNDDEAINITDGIYILNFLFLGGPSPTSPGPTDLPCAPDPIGTNLGCESYGGC